MELNERQGKMKKLADGHMRHIAEGCPDPGLLRCLAKSLLSQAGLVEEANRINDLEFRHRVTREFPTVPSPKNPTQPLRIKGKNDRISQIILVAVEEVPLNATVVHQRWTDGPWEFFSPFAEPPIAVWENEEMIQFLKEH